LNPVPTWRNVNGVPHEGGAGVNMCSYWPSDGSLAEAKANEPEPTFVPKTISTAAQREV
jgi:hypothetical protein